MKGFGTYNFQQVQFSDNSLLTFCLAEAFRRNNDLQKIANNFILAYQ